MSLKNPPMFFNSCSFDTSKKDSFFIMYMSRFHLNNKKIKIKLSRSPYTKMEGDVRMVETLPHKNPLTPAKRIEKKVDIEILFIGEKLIFFFVISFREIQ